VRSRPSLLILAAVVVIVASATPAAAKDGKNVSVVINGDGGPSGDTAGLKLSATSMLCRSYPSATTAKVFIKGQGGSRTVKCSKIRGSAGGKTEKVPSTAGGTRKDPIAVGQSANVGGGWTMKVTNVVANANIAVKTKNEFNDPPAPGRVFFLVGIEATYNGEQPTSQVSTITFSAVDADHVNYTSQDSCGVIPGAFDYEDVFQGGTVAGNVCWSVDAAKTASLLMHAETGFNSRSVFFALA